MNNIPLRLVWIKGPSLSAIGAPTAAPPPRCAPHHRALCAPSDIRKVCAELVGLPPLSRVGGGLLAANAAEVARIVALSALPALTLSLSQGYPPTTAYYGLTACSSTVGTMVPAASHQLLLAQPEDRVSSSFCFRLKCHRRGVQTDRVPAWRSKSMIMALYKVPYQFHTGSIPVGQG